jgi:hypothetical protein
MSLLTLDTLVVSKDRSYRPKVNHQLVHTSVTIPALSVHMVHVPVPATTC